MSLEQELFQRSDSKCELCTSGEDLNIFHVSHAPAGADAAILICKVCREQIEDPETTDPNHWRCVNAGMWGPVPAVQVVARRMLTRLKAECWPQVLRDLMHMEDDVKDLA